MPERFDARAWLAWLIAAGIVALGIRSPYASAVVIGVAGVVASSFASPGDTTVRTMVRIGVAFTLVRALLFALTGHTGDTTLLTLPSLALPIWLGGFTLGGALTAEVLAESLAEGMRMIALLVAFGAFLRVVRVHRLLRMLPGAMFEAGLIVTIAVVFVPSLMREARDIADAQRLRGHRFRGIRSMLPLVAPLLEGALDRSLALAASMEVRGYGRASGDSRVARRWLLAGVTVSLAGVAAWMSLGRGAGTLLLFAGIGAMGAGLRAGARASQRTRSPADRLRAHDLTLVGASALVVPLTAWARARPAAAWYAYPSVELPAADVVVVLPVVALLAPVLIDRVRARRLRARGGVSAPAVSEAA